MQVIQSSKPNKVIYSWCSNLEQGALDQIKLLVEQPFVFRHAALMPDAHFGGVMPVGGVLATKNVVIPSCVGVDIGCGMCAMKTSLKVSDFGEGKKEELLHSIERDVPVGFEHNNDKRQNVLSQNFGDKIEYLFLKNDAILNASFQIFKEPKKDVLSQLGTLGGGNHFLEIQFDQDENIWVMIHSGSRNMGKKICDRFDEIASDINKKYYSGVSESVPFLPTDTLEGKEYLAYMNFALAFAFLNRQVMMEHVKNDIAYAFNPINVTFDDIINIHHNYASLENHFGENVWVHRKGATLATKNTIGIIPGAAGKNSASYIVKGKGNSDSYMSCSHGAGRRMGRKEFNRISNTPEKLKEIVDSLEGITHSKFKPEQSYKKNKETGLLDVSEAEAAYKDIFSVMSQQEDLVDILTTLRTFINMKG